MPVSFSLRPATAADWPAAWPIQREAFRELVTATWGGWTPDQVAKCRDAFDVPNTRMVCVGGEVVGWATVQSHDTHDWLDLVVIDPAHQGRGLGGALVQRLMAEAEARGVPLWLSVYRTNPARRLYTRLGFAELPRDPIRLWMVHPASTPRVPPGP